MQKDQSPTQLPLELPHAETRTREDLIVTPANQAAFSLVDYWPQWPSPIVVLCGPEGAGKTHIAEIWAAYSNAYPASATGIDHNTISAAEHGAVLIDDADSPLLDERGLFHLINTIRASGTHLLLTARHPPAVWGVGLPDLLSRLRAATIVELLHPDELLLSAVITKLFADRQVIVDPQVVEYIVRRMERSLSAARRIVDVLDRLAMERKKRISRSMAAEALTEMEALQWRLDV